MEDKNELSDIILEKESSSVLKTKRILIIVAILILLFLVVLISMKLINRPSQQNEANIKTNLPPEPVSQIEKKTKDDQLFKQVPIIEEKPKEEKDKENFEQMVKSLKAKEIKKEKTIEKAEKDMLQAPVAKESVTKTKEIQKKVTNVVTPIKKERETTQKIKQSTALNAQRGIYIQVGATSKLKPDRKFLEKIKKGGYNYALLPIVVKGKKVTKILVGPFKNKTDIKNNLPKIRREINKDAFIYRVR